MELPPVVLRLDLSPFDQTGPRLYVHKIWCWEFADEGRRADACAYLEQRLSATISRWPFIAGSVAPTENNLLELRYSSPPSKHAAKDILIVKNVTSNEFPYTYERLAKEGMPPSVMDPKVLSSVPEWPTAGKTFPALAIQANFIPGGLLLCFAFHHAVADGTAFTTFIKEFGAGIARDSVSSVEDRVGYEFAPGPSLQPLVSFPEYDPGSGPVRVRAPVPVTTRILQFSAETVKKLEEKVVAHVKKMHGDKAFASNIACLSSLVWVAVIRARQERLDPEEITKIGIAVNVRNSMLPRLDDNYFGNAIVHTIASAKVSELLKDDASVEIAGINSSLPLVIVAEVAWRMREATQKVNAKYVDDRLKTFSALPDPGEVCRAYERAMDNSNTGIDFSSWRDQGADVEFNIPGTTTSKVGFWRKAWSPNEGAYNILPRQGGSKGPADWEVSLGLSVEDMEKVCAAEELGAWVSRVLE